MGDIAFSAKLTGFKQIDEVLGKLRTQGLKVMGGALYTEAEDVMTVSKDTWVPVEFGILKSTGHVELPVLESNVVSVRLAYGGPAAPYAVIQHEDAGLHHPGQGRPFYLSGPVLEATPTLGQRLARRWGLAIRDLL